MLTDFTIRNFRGIKELTLPSLKRVNLFVGKNGVGKTSVLEAVSLFARGTTGGLWWATRQRGEHRTDNTEMFCVLELFHGDSNEMEVASGGDKVVVRHTYVEAARLGGAQGDPDALTLGITPPGHWFHQTYSFSEAEQRESAGLAKSRHRMPNVHVSAEGLGEANLRTIWDQLLERGVDRPGHDLLADVHPDVEDVVLSTDGIPLAKVRGSDRRTPLKRQGDGVSRAFGLALAVAAAQNGILVIDEFENGLHYSIQRDVWRFLLKASNKFDVQVFATTHSRDAVYALAEASSQDDHIVYRLNRQDDDSIAAKQFDNERLEYVVGDQLEIR